LRLAAHGALSGASIPWRACSYQKELPHRFIAGADAIGTAERKVAVLQQQINAYRELSTSLAFDEVGGTGNGS
jgi:hypothetical protein